MPFFYRSGHPVVTVDQFLVLAVLELPRIAGQDLLEVARAKRSTAGGLDGWAWNEIKAPLLAWFSWLAVPKVDGDSTPLGQRHLSVLPVVYRLWASLGLCHLKDWDQGWVMAWSLVEAWFSTALNIEEVLSGAGGDQLRVMVAVVIKSFDTVDRSILDCALGRLGLPSWLRKVYFADRCQVQLDLSWRRGQASLGAEMVVCLRDAS